MATELGWLAMYLHAWAFQVFFEVIFTNCRRGHLPKTNKLLSKQLGSERIGYSLTAAQITQYWGR